MDFDDIVKIVDQVKVLEARLAKAEAERAASNAQLASVLHDIHRVEAERDAARAKRDAALAEVAHMKREQQAMIMQHRHDIRDLGELLQDERCKVATIEAAWYAAQSGEARAVEALRAVVAAVLPHEEDTWIMGAVALRHVHRVLDRYEPTLDNQPSALDWLAQQRREAAAEALEKLATDLRQDPWGSTLHDVDSLRGILRTRAAALRAGEVESE